MTQFTKLTDLKKRKEEINNRYSDTESAEWFTSILSKSRSGKVRVRFLQELSDEAELYDASRGTYLGAVEHQAPGRDGFQRRALDTMERDGRDWAQEQHEANPRLGWRPRENFYINVAVEDYDDGEKYVKAVILSRPLESKFVDDLIEEYEKSDGVGITGKTYVITRKGKGPQTTWELSEETDPNKQIDTTGVECYDLSKTAVRYVPYEQQEKFYMSKADIPGALEQLAERDAKKHNITIEEARRRLGITEDAEVNPDDEPSDPWASKSSPEPSYGW